MAKRLGGGWRIYSNGKMERDDRAGKLDNMPTFRVKLDVLAHHDGIETLIAEKDGDRSLLCWWDYPYFDFPQEGRVTIRLARSKKGGWENIPGCDFYLVKN